MTILLDLQITTDHLSNLKNIGKFLVKKTLEKVGQKWSSDFWTNNLVQVVKVFNAFYAPWTNEFVKHRIEKDLHLLALRPV